MNNPRFVAGDMETHFIDRETHLIEDMKRIMEEEKQLEEKLSGIFDERRVVAASAVAAILTQLQMPRKPKDVGD